MATEQSNQIPDGIEQAITLFESGKLERIRLSINNQYCFITISGHAIVKAQELNGWIITQVANSQTGKSSWSFGRV